MNKKAYSYIRFSTAEQAKGRSQKRQHRDCLAYCEKHGLELVQGAEHTFLDAGRSAWKGDHLSDNGQLARFLRLVEDGTIEAGSTLIVESLDRLSRQDVWKVVPWFGKLIDAGIRVVTLTDAKVYEKGGGATDMILSIFIFARANEESNTKAGRLADAFAEKRKDAKEKNKPMGRVCPMWLRLTDDGEAYEPIPHMVKAVERIFELTVSGYGKNTIAKMLNAEGFPVLSKRKDVKGWGTSAVHHVAMNRAVLGEWQPMTKTLDPNRKKREKAGAVIQGYFPAVIAEDLFHRAQKAIEGRRTAKSTKQSVKFNVWAQVGKCIHCGSAMHMVNKGRPPKGHTYIECSIGRKGLCESHKLIRLDHSESVFRLVLARLPSLALVKDSGGKLTRSLEAVEGKLIQQRKEYEELKALLKVRKTIEVVDMVSASRAEVEALERERDRLKGELAEEDAIGFDTFMERLDLEHYEGRAAANALLKRLGVLVYAGREGFVVSEHGRAVFGVGYRDGTAGYLDFSGWWKQDAEDAPHVAAWKALQKAGPLHFVKPLQAGPLAFALEEDADQARYDSLEDEGDAASQYP